MRNSLIWAAAILAGISLAYPNLGMAQGTQRITVGINGGASSGLMRRRRSFCAAWLQLKLASKCNFHPGFGEAG